MEYFYPLIRSLTLPVIPLLTIAVLSTFMEKKLPFETEPPAAGPKVFWGEVLFRLLWGLLFFDLIPAWLYFQFRLQVFSSIWVTALAATALIFILGFLPLTILLGSRFNFNWGHLFFTLVWIFIALSLSLTAVQLAYKL